MTDKDAERRRQEDEHRRREAATKEGKEIAERARKNRERELRIKRKK